MTKQGHEVRSFYREHDLMLAPEERARTRGLTYSGTDLPARSRG
jgi:hypothetical protein